MNQDIKRMVEKYEDLKNDETVQLDNNLKILIKEIDELKDLNKDNDKIEWIFSESNEEKIVEKALNKWLIDSLNKQHIWNLRILISEVKKINEDYNLDLSDNVKKSVGELLKLLTQILSKRDESMEEEMIVDNKLDELNKIFWKFGFPIMDEDCYKILTYDLLKWDDRMIKINIKNSVLTLKWIENWVHHEVKIDFWIAHVNLYKDYKLEWFSNPVETEDWAFVIYPKLYREEQDIIERKNRSEWLNRKIEIIRVNSDIKGNLFSQLCTIGKKLWFKIEVIPSKGERIEDYSIRRHDWKIYIPFENFEGDFVSEGRKGISTISQWQSRKSGNDINHPDFLEENIVRGKSYLEWWNVLNTIVNWKPWAIVWDESIVYSLKAMWLDNTPENIELVKRQIALDLWIEYNQLTFIPQIDFHIDMIYRPLQDGTIAVPDYTLWKGMFKNFVSDTFLQKQEYLNWLTEMEKASSWILQEAEKQLIKWWYKIRKVPSFTIPNERYQKLKLKKNTPKINFMNGVWWTTKDGITYYITNTSTFPELDEAIGEYLKKNGINAVYFLNTQRYLNKFWAFDCLTQEI